MQWIKEGGNNWFRAQELPNELFVCGFCSVNVSSIKGYKLGSLSDGSGNLLAATYICPNCGGPNFITTSGFRNPSPPLGRPVKYLPQDLESLYEESRRCTSQGCFTGAVLLCRKMLMNIAVNQGAEEGLKFIEYVNFLATSGFVPPNGKHWVDHIRKKGNEATHEIALMTESDARDLISFTEMLLRFIYEFPQMVPSPQ